MYSILVIEDNPNSARLVHKLLIREGFDVTVVDEGVAGYEAALANVPDLILVDLGLPDMDGQTIVAMLKQQPSIADCPLIAFTAWPEETAHAMARAYGCDGVITKPIDTRSFVSDVKNYLQRRTELD